MSIKIRRLTLSWVVYGTEWLVNVVEDVATGATYAIGDQSLQCLGERPRCDFAVEFLATVL
jgi:hypothetical protein